MAQFRTTFNEYAVGGVSNLTDWTRRWAMTNTFEVVADGAGDKAIRLATPSSGASYDSILTWNDVPNQNNNIELLGIVRTNSISGSEYGPALYTHVSGAADPSANAYSYNIISSAGVTYVTWEKYTAGNWTSLLAVARAVAINTDYFMRVRFVSQRAWVKVWAVGTPEPAGWDIDNALDTQGAVLPTGGVGVGAFQTPYLMHFDFFSAGTAGSAAPLPNTEIGIDDAYFDVLAGSAGFIESIEGANILYGGWGVGMAAVVYGGQGSNPYEIPAVEGADATFGLSADDAALMQHYTLTPDDAALALSSDTAALVQAYTVSPDDGTFDLTTEGVYLGERLILRPHDATFPLASDSAALTQKQILAIQDAVFALTSDSPAVVTSQYLTVDDATFFITVEPATVSKRIEKRPRTPRVVLDIARVDVIDNRPRVSVIPGTPSLADARFEKPRVSTSMKKPNVSSDV